jgi:hypothetical protein
VRAVFDGTASVSLSAVTGAGFPLLGLQGEYPMAETGRNITLSDVSLQTVPAVAAAQQFDGILQAVGGTNAAVATSIAATINDGVSIGLMHGAGTNYISAMAPVGAVITLLATTLPGVPLAGPDGNALTYTSDDPAFLVQDAQSAVTGTLNRTYQLWTPTQQATAVQRLVARVDGGLPLTLTDIDAVLVSVGAELTNAAGSSSTGTVADILEILSGRVYRIPRTNPTTGAVIQYMDVAHPTYLWGAAGAGGFTAPETVFGTHMIAGEIKPLAISGDTVNREVKGVRHTYDTAQFQLSLLRGVLNSMTGPTVLFPDSDEVPYFPWTMQHGTHYSQTTASRLVTVYDDDGTVLA